MSQSLFDGPGCRHLRYILFYQHPRITLYCIVLTTCAALSFLVWLLIYSISMKQREPIFFISENSTMTGSFMLRDLTSPATTGLYALGYNNSVYIQSRNSNGWPQNSGGDTFTVTLQSTGVEQCPQSKSYPHRSEDSSRIETVPDIYTQLRVHDNLDGTYVVPLPVNHLPSGCYRIDVHLTFSCKTIPVHSLDQLRVLTYPQWDAAYPCVTQPIGESPLYISLKTSFQGQEKSKKAKMQRCGARSSGLYGRFVSIPKCQYPYCSGTLSSIPTDADYRHVFVPYDCYYHIFDAKEAKSCLKNKRITFVGDSLTRGYYWALYNLLQGRHSPNESLPIYEDASSKTRIELLQIQTPHRVGLQNIFLDRLQTPFIDAMVNSDMVIFNSGFHDIAATLDHSVRPHPFVTYEQTLDRFYQSLNRTRIDTTSDKKNTENKEIPRASFIWRQTSCPKSMIATAECDGEHIRTDIVKYLNTISTKKAKEWGASVIDDFEMTWAAHPNWFRDHLHTSQGEKPENINRSGGLQHMMMHALLNHICTDAKLS